MFLDIDARSDVGPVAAAYRVVNDTELTDDTRGCCNFFLPSRRPFSRLRSEVRCGPFRSFIFLVWRWLVGSLEEYSRIFEPGARVCCMLLYWMLVLPSITTDFPPGQAVRTTPSYQPWHPSIARRTHGYPPPPAITDSFACRLSGDHAGSSRFRRFTILPVPELLFASVAVVLPTKAESCRFQASKSIARCHIASSVRIREI